MKRLSGPTALRLFTPFACLMLISGCASIAYEAVALMRQSPLEGNPPSIVGKCYEIQPVATSATPTKRAWRRIAGFKTPVALMQTFAARLKSLEIVEEDIDAAIDNNLAENLNQSSNGGDAEAPLKVQILDYCWLENLRKLGQKYSELDFKILDSAARPDLAHMQPLFKIKVLNKKYAGATYWILGDQFNLSSPKQCGTSTDLQKTQLKEMHTDLSKRPRQPKRTQ